MLRVYRPICDACELDTLELLVIVVETWVTLYALEWQSELESFCQVPEDVTRAKQHSSQLDAIVKEFPGAEIAPCALVEDEHPSHYVMAWCAGRQHLLLWCKKCEGTKSNLPTIFALGNMKANKRQTTTK